MRSRSCHICSIALAFLCIFSISAFSFADDDGTAPGSPSEFLGTDVGADRVLADWSQIERYYRYVAEISSRVEIVEVGKSYNGRNIIAAIVTSPENHARMDELIQAQHDITYMDRQPDEETRWQNNRPFVLINTSMHSTEVGPVQFSLKLLHRLATDESQEVGMILDRVVTVIMPNINPDGVDMVVEFYRKYLGTEYEGASPPWLYHEFAGHDNNRDWYMLNLKEVRAVNSMISKVWFPQVVWDAHQMGSRGYRAVIPPFLGPPNPFIHPLVLTGIENAGHAMRYQAIRDNHQGIAHSNSFSVWWNGGFRTTPYFKNSIGLLTEMASASLATPIEVTEEELSEGRRNYTAKTVNNPYPWKGGRWGLPEIISTQESLARGLLRHVALNAENIVRDYRTMCLHGGVTGEDVPGGYLILREQHDPGALAQLIWIFQEHGIEVHQIGGLSDYLGRDWPEGTIAISNEQPFSPMVRSLLERVQYPEGGDAEQNPYDVSASTLSDLMGVEVVAVSPLDWHNAYMENRLKPLKPVTASRPMHTSSGQSIYNAGDLSSYKAVNELLSEEAMVMAETRNGEMGGTAHEFVQYDPGHDARAMDITPDIEAARERSIKQPRLGILRGYYGSMDEGWTRYLMEEFAFAYESLDEQRIIDGDLAAEFDVIILPGISTDRLMKGRSEDEKYPPEFRGGIGEEGVASLKAFVEAGGTLICMERSSQMAVEKFELPVTIVNDELERGDLNVPGSIVRLIVDTSDQLGFGMQREVAAMFSQSLAFKPKEENADAVDVVAHYAEEDLLLGGFAEGEEHIAGTAAVVNVKHGEGRVVLVGFPALFRGQTYATFKLVFNAILTSAGTFHSTLDPME